jgi:hypothetical protein
MEIGVEGAYRYYAFYCKCIPSYDRYPTFIYLFKSNNKVLKNKPTVSYISWKSLSELLYTQGKKFNESYTLFIVQTLINNEYTMNETKLHIVPPPIVDFTIIH